MLDNARKRTVDFVLLAIIVAAWLVACAAISTGVERGDGSWHIPGPLVDSLRNVAIWAAPIVSVVIFAATVLRRRGLAMAASVLIAGLGGIMALGMSFLESTNHVGEVRVTAADGHEYMLLANGFQDWEYQLGRIESESYEKIVVRPLARTSDYSSHNVRLVRPRGADASGGVRMSPDGRYVVVEIWPGCASIGYDTRTQQRWSSEYDETPNIEDLSPFILLDDDDELHPGDVEALRGVSICPRSKSLDELDAALYADHPNRNVRSLFDPDDS